MQKDGAYLLVLPVILYVTVYIFKIYTWLGKKKASVLPQKMRWHGQMTPQSSSVPVHARPVCLYASHCLPLNSLV